MKRMRRIMLALTLALAIAASGAVALRTLYRMNTQDASEVERAAEGPAAARLASPASATPSFVSLRMVSQINRRARSLTAVTTAAVSTSGEMQTTMDAHPELTYVNTQLDDLPLLEVFRDDGESRPLLLFLHGLGNDKESVIGALSAFAEAGYHAVGVDAFDQGERRSRDASCDTWAAMLITVGDVDPIIEYFETVENVETERFVLGGFSMGAVESMAYVETGSHTPAAVIALCGMCELNAWQPWQQDSITSGWMSEWRDSVWTFPEWQELGYSREKLETILSMNVTENLDSFADVPVLCCIGTADPFFSARSIRSVTQRMQIEGNGAASCIVYPGGGHEITDAMLADSLRFLDSVSL